MAVINNDKREENSLLDSECLAEETCSRFEHWDDADYTNKDRITLGNKFCYYSAALIAGTYNLGRGLVTAVTPPIMSLEALFENCMPPECRG